LSWTRLLPSGFYRWLCGSLLIAFSAGAHSGEKQVLKLLDANAVVWAVNLGGEQHQTSDGVTFQADPVGVNNSGALTALRGAQDPAVYLSYRMGELDLQQTLADGIYDLTFYFVEPEGAASGERVFDVIAQGQTVIEHLDISLSRSSPTPSALKRTVTGVEVNGGTLRLQLKAIKSRPVMSGFSVRSRQPEARQWRQVWSDEFDYEGLPDPARWHVDQWPARKVNDEDQAYTARADNVRVASGSLILQAHKEDYQGAAFTSGRVHGRGLGDVLYGRIDIRAKLPRGQGLWSALWMLPSDPYHYATTCDDGKEWQGNPDCDAWPNSGEIDIMEHVGYDMKRVHSTVHTQRFFSSGPDLRNASIEVADVAGGFHVYSLEWAPEVIRVFVDGVEFYRYDRNDADWRDWPFDQPFHLIMNLAVGGFWGRAGGPIDSTAFPAKMEIDYVRVFEPVVSE
jgi:beta-glucanase (GH16 family)